MAPKDSSSTSTITPGIMWINSGVIKPDHLSDSEFDHWYSDEHIPDVVALSGVNSAARYRHVDTSHEIVFMGTKSSSGRAARLKFLTVYEMRDLGFTQTTEFRGLEGQNPASPSKDKIFLWTEFDTRFYEKVYVHDAEDAELGPATLLLSIALTHRDDAAYTTWNLASRIPRIASCPGYRRSRHFRIQSRSVLSSFERSYPPTAPMWLSLYEFDGRELPWTELKQADAAEETREVLRGIEELDWDLFRLARTY